MTKNVCGTHTEFNYNIMIEHFKCIPCTMKTTTSNNQIICNLFLPFKYIASILWNRFMSCPLI